MTAVGKQRSPDTRLPITKPVLFQLVHSLQHTNSSAEQCTLFTAMFLIAFYGFFRIGELASKSPASGKSVVQFNSLPFLSWDGCIQSLKITIFHFKHNTNNRPVDVIITREKLLSYPFPCCNYHGSQSWGVVPSMLIDHIFIVVSCNGMDVPVSHELWHCPCLYSTFRV